MKFYNGRVLNNTPRSRETLAALWKIQKLILDTLDFTQVVQKIVDSIAIELDYLKLGYRAVVLVLADEKAGVLKRVSMSQTSAAEAIMGAGKMTFDEIEVPLGATENFCVKTYIDHQIRITRDWKDILTPPMVEEEARRLQQVSAVKNSLVYPIMEREKCIGVMIFSLEKEASEMSDEEKDLIQSFTDIVSLAVHDAKIYAELDAANDKLKELDKLKDEFISIASHELRAPAGVVKNYLWTVINGKKKLPEQVISDLQKAYGAGDRLAGLVDELLDVSGIEAGRLEMHEEEFDLGQLIIETAEEYQNRAGVKKVKLDAGEVKDGVVKVKTDRNKIHQVTGNLIDNAIKFTPEGGTVTVKVNSNRGNARVVVTDTGVGIAKEDQSRLFTKFGRIDTSGTEVGRTTGTGLGLYICKRIVELSKGKIWVESQPKKGTKMLFELPSL